MNPLSPEEMQNLKNMAHKVSSNPWHLSEGQARTAIEALPRLLDTVEELREALLKSAKRNHGEPGIPFEECPRSDCIEARRALGLEVTDDA